MSHGFMTIPQFCHCIGESSHKLHINKWVGLQCWAGFGPVVYRVPVIEAGTHIFSQIVVLNLECTILKSLDEILNNFNSPDYNQYL